MGQSGRGFQDSRSRRANQFTSSRTQCLLRCPPSSARSDSREFRAIGQISCLPRFSDVLCGRQRELDFAAEHLLEQVAPATRPPQREFGVTVHAQTQDHEVGADVGAHVVDDTAPAAVETVGDAEQRRELADADAIVG